jgi:hypothetical protein
VTIPRPEDLSPAYRKERDDAVELAMSTGPLRNEIAQLRAMLHSQGNVFHTPPENDRVRALAGETLPPPLPSLKEQLNSKLVELDHRQRAIELRQHKVRQGLAVASRMVCNAVKPEVERLGRLYAEAYVNLHAAMKSYFEMFDAIEATGANTSSLPKVYPNALGHFADCSGGFHYAFKEFLDANLIDRASIPVEVR